MNKKVLIGALAVMLALAMVSCSLDEYAKLGDLMGKMGSNVYGITPNMQDVAAATESLSNAVTVTKDETGAIKVEVKLVDSTELISSVATIKDSTQKTQELKKQLAEPISTDAEVAKAVQEALQKEVKKVTDDVLDTIDAETVKNDTVKQAVESVKKALDQITDGISENPTKADLATVSIVNDLATTVAVIAKNEDNKYMDADGNAKTDEILKAADKALSALDTLKVTSEAAELDILKDFDLSSLLSGGSSSAASGVKSASKASSLDEETLDKLLDNATESFIKMVSKNGKFDETRYKKCIFQLRAIRTAYEMTSLLATTGVNAKDDFAFVDALLEGKNIVNLKRFSINDAVLYFSALVFTEYDNLYKVKDANGNETSNAFKEAVKDYANRVNDEDSKSLFKSLEDAVVDSSKKDELKNKAITAVNTTFVIVIDSGFDVKNLYKLEEGDTYGEFIKSAYGDLEEKLFGTSN